MPTASYPLIKESVKKKLKASKQIFWPFQTTRFTPTEPLFVLYRYLSIIYNVL